MLYLLFKFGDLHFDSLFIAIFYFYLEVFLLASSLERGDKNLLSDFLYLDFRQGSDNSLPSEEFELFSLQP